MNVSQVLPSPPVFGTVIRDRAGRATSGATARGPCFQCSGCASNSLAHATLVQVSEEIGWIRVDPIGTGANQLVFAITTRKHTHPQGSRSARRQQIPDAVAHHHAVLDFHAEALGGRDE